MAGLRRKLGLFTEQDGDVALAEDLLKLMANNRADFTLTFRRLSDAAAGSQAKAAVRSLFADPTAYDSWAVDWRNRLRHEAATDEERAAVMRHANPAFIPRNHKVEELINAAVDRGDFQPFEELLSVVKHPYEEQPEQQQFSLPALPEQLVRQTFCGT